MKDGLDVWREHRREKREAARRTLSPDCVMKDGLDVWRERRREKREAAQRTLSPRCVLNYLRTAESERPRVRYFPDALLRKDLQKCSRLRLPLWEHCPGEPDP